jgi:hypothetical protein
VTRFRALLLGAGEYDDPRIRALPCVRTDIVEVAKSLEKRGYELDESSDLTGRLTRPQLMESVGRFLDGARDGDTLLVYLSGHGVHTDGMTYLIPSDAPLGRMRLSFFSVPLEAWREDIEQSAADGIVFLVDACREGYDETAMAVTRQGWDAERIARAGRSQVAWIFPCGEGEVARFVRAEESGGKPFSLFAQSVVMALQDRATPATLDGFTGVVAEQVAGLAAKYGKPRQEVHAHVSRGHRPFAVLPAPAGGPHDWEGDVSGHEAWKHIGEAGTAEPLRTQTLSLVRHLTRIRLRSWPGGGLPKDPWADAGFAARMSSQVAFLLRNPLRALELSPAEAALLAAAPYLHDTHWAAVRARYAWLLAPAAKQAADPTWASFDRYVQGYPRLRRKVDAGEGDAGGQLSWWLLYRWAAGRPEAYAPDEIARLLPAEPLRLPGGEVFSPAHLRALLRVIRADTGFFADPGNAAQPPDDVVIASGKADEQVLRLRLVAYIVAVAQRMAVEAAFLSEVVADHLGVADPIDLAGLHATLDDASWTPLGGYGRDLSARCAHPAVETALREHAADFDGLLRQLHTQAARRSSVAVLGALPARASADGVGPLVLDGRTAYDDAGVRFRLAEDRVQELLMGEQLYGKPTAAIRELYQNALDACRYRRARTEYLGRTKHLVTDWTGEIRFEQGRDGDGRDYLDCADNGIGMGRRELRDLFARAGARYVELPEFLEEKYEWDQCDPPVKLIPNSRFGVGVLSYFMLADEIVVDTCRLGRDGKPGDRLRVSIAGPGALFRIQYLGPGEEAGTTVRLYLNPATERVSCLDVLGQVLWVAEFATRAAEGDRVYTWKPGALWFSEEGKARPLHLANHIAAGPRPVVWWVDSRGGILVDGVAVSSEQAVRGVIVNLSGEQAKLSVDRTKIISLRAQEFDELLRGAIPFLLSGKPSFLTFGWLWQLAYDRASVADDVQSAMLRSGVAKLSDPSSFWAGVDLPSLGCFPPDAYLDRQSERWRDHRNGWEGCLPGDVGYDCPDNIAVWRLGALAAAGGRLPRRLAQLSRPEGPALPSDHVLLRVEQHEHGATWLDVRRPVNAGHVLKVAGELGRSVAEVTARLAHLGYHTPDVAVVERDAGLASVNGDGQAPWDTDQDMLELRVLKRKALSHGLNVDECADRLRALGYDARPEGDLRLLDFGFEESDPWWPVGSRVPSALITYVARELALDDAEVARQMTALGYQARPHRVGAALLDLQFDGRPLVDFDESWFLPLRWAADVARRLGVPLAAVREELRLAGCSVVEGQPPSYLAQYIDEDDWRSDKELPRTWNGRGSHPYWRSGPLQPSDVMTRASVLCLALETGVSPRQVAADLAALGFRVPSFPSGATVSKEHPVVLSQDLDGREPWLKDDALVPAGHVIAAVQRNGVLGMRDIVRLLTSVGYRVPDLSDVSQDDKTLLSFDLNGRNPWLPSYQPVGVWHLGRVAVRLGWDPAKSAARLRELGYEVPAV